MTSHFPILDLPTELKRRTASFLSPYNAVNLSRTCQSLNKALALSSLEPPPQTFISRIVCGHITKGDDPIQFVRLPALYPRMHLVHSLTLILQWRDLGRGNRKGQLLIVGRHKDQPVDKEDQFCSGRVLCESPLADHTLQECRLTFVPREFHLYHLWYKCSGGGHAGGGHALQLDNGVLHTMIYDDANHHTANNYRLLRELDLLVSESMHLATEDRKNQFFPKMLCQVVKSVRRQLASKSKPDHDLVSLLEEYAIPVSEESLLAVEDIVQADRKERSMMIQDREDVWSRYDERRLFAGAPDDFSYGSDDEEDDEDDDDEDDDEVDDYEDVR